MQHHGYYKLFWQQSYLTISMFLDLNWTHICMYLHNDKLLQMNHIYFTNCVTYHFQPESGARIKYCSGVSPGPGFLVSSSRIHPDTFTTETKTWPRDFMAIYKSASVCGCTSLCPSRMNVYRCMCLVCNLRKRKRVICYFWKFVQIPPSKTNLN